ncbi:hypothetical protein ACU8NH_24210 [Rhizobium leguminosarum]
MKPNAAAKIRQEEDRKSRRAAERIRKWIEELRRQVQAEQDRRRKWLLLLLLLALEAKPAQRFFPSPAPTPPLATTSRSPARKSEKKAAVETLSDYDRHSLYDHRPRRGEEHLEVYDGLTWNDIIANNRIHRPHLFPAFRPIPGMPKRYADQPVNIWTLFDHIDSAYHRPDAIKALKLIVHSSAHDWIDACATEVGELTYKDLRRQCKRRTPAMTLHEFPRAATWWRESVRREEEEKKRTVKETPDDAPKPPGVD